jgi:hypothetical protein
LPSTINRSNCCFSLSKPEMISISRWNISDLRDQHPAGRIAIVADHYRPAEWLWHFGRRQRLFRQRQLLRCVHQIHRTGGDG